MLPPGEITMIPLSWKVKLLSSQFGPLMLFNTEIKKGINVITG